MAEGKRAEAGAEKQKQARRQEGCDPEVQRLGVGEAQQGMADGRCARKAAAGLVAPRAWAEPVLIARLFGKALGKVCTGWRAWRVRGFLVGDGSVSN